MKNLKNSIIVVEGTSDVVFLSTFIDSSFQITNGSSVPRETLDYLKEASKTKDIIILTDPDFPGQKIRQTVNDYVPGCLNAYVRKEYSIKKNKLGVAESTKEEVLRALDNITTSKNSGVLGTLSQNDLYKLGLTGSEDSKEKREFISNHFNLGFNNAKTLLKKLNMFNISYEEIERALNGRK